MTIISSNNASTLFFFFSTSDIQTTYTLGCFTVFCISLTLSFIIFFLLLFDFQFECCRVDTFLLCLECS